MYFATVESVICSKTMSRQTTKTQGGHSSLRTTSGYTHFSDAFKREVVEQLAPSWTHSEQLDSVAVGDKSS